METQKRRLPGVLYATGATVLLWGAHLYAREFMKLDPGDTLRLIITSALVLAFLWLVVEQVRLSRHLDEFHRQVQYLALGIAFPVALVLTFAIGFFRAEGLFAGADSRDLFMVLILSYAAGWTIAWRRYA
ncbi:hypothetical protein L0222_25170 [bacterium]|nr:hypothetical protein [bacterium]MCI0606257.1 hypothetical protein [bacterium]